MHSSIFQSMCFQDVLEDSSEFGPLVINTSIPSPTPPSSALDNTPPLTEDTTSPDTAQVEDGRPQCPSSPGLDIPPSSAADVAPLSLTLPSTPTSPDHPSTPSSLNSSCSLLESSANKQRRGKKVGVVDVSVEFLIGFLFCWKNIKKVVVFPLIFFKFYVLAVFFSFLGVCVWGLYFVFWLVCVQK